MSSSYSGEWPAPVEVARIVFVAAAPPVADFGAGEVSRPVCGDGDACLATIPMAGVVSAGDIAGVGRAGGAAGAGVLPCTTGRGLSSPPPESGGPDDESASFGSTSGGVVFEDVDRFGAGLEVMARVVVSGEA